MRPRGSQTRPGAYAVGFFFPPGVRHAPPSHCFPLHNGHILVQIHPLGPRSTPYLSLRSRPSHSFAPSPFFLVPGSTSCGHDFGHLPSFWTCFCRSFAEPLLALFGPLPLVSVSCLPQARSQRSSFWQTVVLDTVLTARSSSWLQRASYPVEIFHKTNASSATLLQGYILQNRLDRFSLLR